MSVDVHLVPASLDLYHLILIGSLGAMVVLMIILTLLWLRQKGRIAELEVHSGGVKQPIDSSSQDASDTTVKAVRLSTPEGAMQLLGLLQNEARFVDFLQEEISVHADADIGAAARVVHEGCRKVIRGHFDLVPIRAEAENSRITLQEGFDPSANRITGHIVGQPPFSGTLIHKGWCVQRVDLPKVTDGHDLSIIAAAEIEL